MVSGAEQPGGNLGGTTEKPRAAGGHDAGRCWNESAAGGSIPSPPAAETGTCREFRAPIPAVWSLVLRSARDTSRKFALSALPSTAGGDQWSESSKVSAEALLRDDAKALRMFREATMAGQGARTDLVDNINE